jgi:hypothetical protein
MNGCPYCQAEEKQVKAGKNTSGSQRYQCQRCERKYTPEPNEYGYWGDHKTVMHWVKAYTVAKRCEQRRTGWIVHLCRQETNVVYVITLVDRITSSMLGWGVSTERNEAVRQCLVWPLIAPYFTRQGYTLRCLTKARPTVWRGQCGIALLLAHLARKSRCIEALRLPSSVLSLSSLPCSSYRLPLSLILPTPHKSLWLTPVWFCSTLTRYEFYFMWWNLFHRVKSLG